MADNQYGLEAQWQLNRLAGTLDANKRPLYDADEAANIWAGTVDLPLVAALNYKAGLTGFNRKDFVGVCNILAGTTGLGAPKALSLIPDALGTLGQDAVFWIDANRGGTAGQRISNLGTAGSLLDVQVGSTAGAGLTVVPGSHVHLPGVGLNYISVPDANDLDITGDIDLRAFVALDDWTPSASMVLVAKEATATTRSFRFFVQTNGTLALATSVGGSTVSQTVASTVAVPASDGAPIWVRVTLDVDNGASGNDARFWTSADGSSWTQLGTTVTTAGTTSIFSSTSSVEVGARLAGTLDFLAGKVYRAQVFSGIDGTKVLDVDCAQATTTSNLFTAVTGQTVTINRTGVDSNDPKWLLAEDKSYVYLPGVSGNYLSVPDANNLDITGDLDIRVQVAADDWTPSANQQLISKWEADGPTNSWYLRLTTDGKLTLAWAPTNGTSAAATSSVATGITDGSVKWIRATLDVDNGASGNDVKFWTSDDGTTWTQLGTTVTQSGTTQIYVGTGRVIVGSIRGDVEMLAGKVFRAQVLNGINGTTVLDVDTSVLKSGSATSFTALTGQTVTISRSSSGRKTVVVPSRVLEKVEEKHVYLPGVVGNYLSVPDSAQLDITGDLDVRVQVGMNSWLPAASESLISKLGSSGNYSWDLRLLSTSGVLSYRWSTNGTTLTTVNSTVAPLFSGGTIRHVRVTHDVDNGASGNDVKFFTSTDGVNWSQVGSTVTTAGITSIFSSAAQVEVGSTSSSTYLSGDVYRAQILNGIDGTLVLDVDAKDAPLNFTAGTANSFKAKTGQTVTMNSTAGSGMLVVDARSATGSSCWLFGTDDYLEVANRWVDGASKNVYLPGVVGNYMSVPDSAALDVTSDIDIRVKVALDDWTPSASMTFVGKRTSGQFSYQFGIATSGLLTFACSGDGSSTTIISINSSVAPTVSDGGTLWVGVQRNASTGTVTFRTSSDGTTWTQLGTQQTGLSTSSMFAGTAPLEIGTVLAGTAGFCQGRFYRAQIRNGIDGTVVFDANMETSITSVGQTSFTESSSNAATVTINRSGTGYVSTGVTQSGYIYPTGVANLTPSAISLLDFGASDSFTVISVVRLFSTPASNQRIVSKIQGASAGYQIRNSGTNAALLTTATDGTNGSGNIGINYVPGSLVAIAAVIDRTANTNTKYLNALLGDVSNMSAVGSLVNGNSLRIGRGAGTDTAYLDGEFVATAIFRKALTAAEIKAIVEYYQRTVK